MRGGTRKSHVNNKTPRVHEVEYTPAMDFLLRKVAWRSRVKFKWDREY